MANVGERWEELDEEIKSESNLHYLKMNFIKKNCTLKFFNSINLTV